MTTEFLPFCKPSINQAAIDEVTECLKSGWITTGPRVKRFEEALQAYLKAPHTLALTSATAGLHLALLSLDLKPGDEVITTPLTFVATANTIVLAGAKPVFVDIDPTTLNMDVTKIEALITKRTRAILPVHFAGLPVDLDPLYTLANHYQCRVIEDCAHAIGAYYKNNIIGSMGDTHVFSFHPNKNMTTGEGGCVTTRDEILAKKITTLRFHGIDREAWNRFGKQGNQHYQVFEPGFKYNMMDIQAALGLHQLPELDLFIEKRSQLVQRYYQLLSDWPELSLPKAPAYSHKHAWHLFTPLILPEVAGIDRDQFIEAMKEHHIGTGYHYQAVHLHPYYQQQFHLERGHFPNTEYVSDRVVSLPLFPDMTIADQDRVIEAMKEIFSLSRNRI